MAVLVSSKVPCVVFEDDHLLVINKPSGMNTHAPAPYAGAGIHEWLRERDSAWATISILHRLDKETSGLMLFGKSTLANRSISEQFEKRTIQKSYLFITASKPVSVPALVKTGLARAGNYYITTALGVGDNDAETLFEVVSSGRMGTVIRAKPRTGRTHQIRVHAASIGCPILGDTLYGGAVFKRICLHSAALTLAHPATKAPLLFESPIDFEADSSRALRAALIDPQETDAFRLVNGHPDGRPGVFVERWGDALLASSEHELTSPQVDWLRRIMLGEGCAYANHKLLSRQVRKQAPVDSSPLPMLSADPSKPIAPPTRVVRENGVRYEISFAEGYSVGLFLDQRENRRRLLMRSIGHDFPLWSESATKPAVLNVFSYTCAFSVCAALAGARTTSLDLSKKYLEWGRRNMVLNGLDPAHHDFIYGDAFDWMKRLAKKGRKFDCVILDPPTFSQSKEHGVWRAAQDYQELVRVGEPLIAKGGVLLASTNVATMDPSEFVSLVEAALKSAGRTVSKSFFAPQPPDFPMNSTQPGYLKTLWMKLD